MEVYLGFISVLTGICVATVPWRPSWTNRSDLLCTPPCSADEDSRCSYVWSAAERQRALCCPCNNTALWELQQLTNLTVLLNLKYNAINASWYVFPSKRNLNNARYWLLRHINGNISSWPEGMCTFGTRLVLVDFSANRLTEIGNVFCLTALDTLNLTRNELKYIRNNTFVGLKNLRILDLSENEISMLEPGTLSVGLESLMRIDFSRNKLVHVDVTDFILNFPFCTLDYHSNKIEYFTNVFSWKIDSSSCYGPGIFRVDDNKFDTFFDFKHLLGVEDLMHLGKLFAFDIESTGISFNCDCRMVPFILYLTKELANVLGDHFHVFCRNPPSLNGSNVFELIQSNRIDEFVCDSDRCFRGQKCIPECEPSKNCTSPVQCHYLDQPSQNRFIVNCTGKYLTNLPIIPNSISKNVELYLANNSISTLDAMEYSSKVSVLDLSWNKLEFVTEEAINKMNPDKLKLLNLDKNPSLHYLPGKISKLSPNQLYFGTDVFYCDCQSRWMYEWFKVKGNTTTTGTRADRLMCKTKGGAMPIVEYFEEFVDCSNSNLLPASLPVGLGCGVASILVIALTVFHFRYEVKLLFRLLCHKTNCVNDLNETKMYDVFISSDEEDPVARKWVKNSLLKRLEKFGYKAFFPIRQQTPGEVRLTATTEAMWMSRNILVVLSHSYAGKDCFTWNGEEEGLINPWPMREWHLAWQAFMKGKIMNLVVVNFDQIETSVISDKSLKAFIRLGLDYDFSNRTGRFWRDILGALQTPEIVNARGYMPI